LLDEENTHSELVQSRLTELTQLWEDLKELSAARHEALNGAKQVIYLFIYLFIHLFIHSFI
jgi:hypothetical protein